MTRRRVLDWVLIVALMGSFAVLFAHAVEDGLRTGRGRVPIGVSSAAASDAYPTVRWSGWQELRPGDQIEAVDGEDLLGLSALRFYDRVTRGVRERGYTTLRANHDGTSFEVRGGFTPTALWWMPLASVLVSLVGAMLVLVLAPGWHLSRRNLVVFWCFAAAVAIGSRGAAATTSFETNLAWILDAAYVGLGIWILQEFTLSARPVPRPHRALALAATLALGVLYLTSNHLAHTPAVYRIVLIAAYAFPVAVAAAGLTRAYRRSDLVERRRMRWVILGVYVALSGGILRALASSDGQIPTFAHVIQATLRLGFPIGVLVSVVGYRWLDIDRLISAAASYTLVGIAVLGGAVAIIPRLAQEAAPALGIDVTVAQWLLTMTLVGAAIPAHRFLWPVIDRRLFGERHHRMLGFELLLDEIAGYASVEELVRLAAERIDTLLEPESIALYARDGMSFAPLFVRGREAPSVLEADSLLVRALDRGRRPLWADAAELDAFDRATLETLGVSLVVPIRGHDGVVAFSCLGPKRSGDIYTPEEIAQLGAVAERCSAVLRRLAEPLSSSGSAEPLPQVFRRDGEFWTIASAGKEIRLRDMRGLHYLATLLREPGREFHASDLAAAANGSPRPAAREDPALEVVRGLGDAGPRLDAQARAAYRERLDALEEELDDAERCSDLSRLERVREEREALLAELGAAARGQRASSHGERARVAVTKAIKAAIERIAEGHPELGAHLSETIRRGYFCVYLPEPSARIEWEV